MSIQIPEKYNHVYESICNSFKDLLDCLNTDFIDLPEKETVSEIENRLQQKLFTLVFVGGFNTGKSSLINVLFQREIFKAEERKTAEEKLLQPLCFEDATPATSKIHILKWGAQEKEELREKYILEQEVPNPRLKELHMEIVDTPGTDSTNEMHDKITRAFIPKADMIFFLFSVDQPFTLSEREFLRLIYNNWKREIIFILNKIDTKRNIQGEVDRGAIDRVVKDIREKSQEFLEREFKIYTLSAQIVKEGIFKDDPSLLELSGISGLEGYINKQLREILHHIKLKSAIQTALRVCEKGQETLGEELGKLETFSEALEQINNFVSNYWNLENQNHSSSLFTDRHSTFKRFDEIVDQLHSRIDQTFNLAQLVMVILKGGADQLVKAFKKDLKTFTESFRINLKEDLEGLVENFCREFGLLLREQKIAEKLKKSDKVLNTLQEGLAKQLSSLVKDFADEDLDQMLDQLTKRMMIALGGWIAGSLVVLGSLSSIATNPFALVTGGIIGGGVIGGAMFWFNLKRRQIKRKFADEIATLKGEFRGNIKTKLQAHLMETYLSSYEKDCGEKKGGLREKSEELQTLKETFEKYQKTLKQLQEEKTREKEEDKTEEKVEEKVEKDD